MASIQKRPNGKWRARYRDTTGKEHARHFTRKVDAQRWLDDVTTAINTGTYVDPRTARMTVGEWCDVWLEGYSGRRASTVRQAKVHIALIKAEFGDTPLAAVRPSHVRSWTAKLAEQGRAQSYIYATYRRLAQLMADAVHDGIIPRSPCSRRTSPKQGEQRPYVATSGQVWALHDAMPAHLAPAVLLGAFAGLRVSEAAGLRVTDVDFMRRVINVAVQYGDAPVKTTSSAASVPIPEDLALMLAAAVKEAKGKAGEKATHVVTDELGRPTSPWAIERALRAVRESVEGLPAGFRFHDLRHHYASTLIDAGLSVKVVQSCLRHQSATTTLNTYGHLFPDTDESARAAVAAALAARADSVRTPATR